MHDQASPAVGLLVDTDLPLVVFDDGQGTFGPLVDLRAAFELRSGLWTLLERIELALRRKAVATVVPAELAPLVRESTGRPVNELPPNLHGEMPVVVVHGCLLDLGVLRSFRGSLGDMLVDSGGRVIAAVVRARDVLDLGDVLNLGDVLDLGRTKTSAVQTVDVKLAQAPWDIVTRVATTLSEDLALAGNAPLVFGCATRQLRPDEGTSFGTQPLLIHPTARVGPCAVIDVSVGPVVLGAGVVVRPGAVLVGPCVVLEGSTVAERSLLKAGTVIGPHCRAGGEIGGTIFQGFSNKSHDGHLGDSFVGEWVNIGAGTDNSNLLNTYGEVIVRLEPDGGLLRTGRQFWGSILGDHVKLAIGTRLMTGTTIGTGAMIASSKSPSTLVQRFAWLTDGASGATDAKTFRIEKFLETARAMMSRRGKSPSVAMESRLREVHLRIAGNA